MYALVSCYSAPVKDRENAFMIFRLTYETLYQLSKTFPPSKPNVPARKSDPQNLLELLASR